MRSARTKVCVTGTEENACTLMNCEEVITSLSAGVQVLLQQMTQTSTSTDLLDSILCCLICSLQQDQASSQVCKLMPVCKDFYCRHVRQDQSVLQAIQAEFWASQGEVSITEAVGFVLAGQADAAAINDSLTDYLKLFALLGRYNRPEQQLQLLRVSQGVLKQAAQIMQMLRQLLQVCTKKLSADMYTHVQGYFNQSLAGHPSA